jgi:hypothetical protein
MAIQTLILSGLSSAIYFLNNSIGMGGAGGAHFIDTASLYFNLHFISDRDFEKEVLDKARIRQHPAHHTAGPFDVAGYSAEVYHCPDILSGISLPF